MPELEIHTAACSALDGDGLAGDGPSAVRYQEQNQVGDVFGCHHAADGYIRDGAAFGFVN